MLLWRSSWSFVWRTSRIKILFWLNLNNDIPFSISWCTCSVWCWRCLFAVRTRSNKISHSQSVLSSSNKNNSQLFEIWLHVLIIRTALFVRTVAPPPPPVFIQSNPSRWSCFHLPGIWNFTERTIVPSSDICDVDMICMYNKYELSGEFSFSVYLALFARQRISDNKQNILHVWIKQSCFLINWK